MKIPFTKMEGLGNDYIYFNCFETPQERLGDLPGLARRLSDRHFGIGGDGIILILPDPDGDARMRMFNLDGSEGAMCGNGLRCVGKFVYERIGVKKEKLVIQTSSGRRDLGLTVENGGVKLVSAVMGEPVLSPKKIPALADAERIVDYPLDIGGTEYKITAVSVGNPHCVIFTDKSGLDDDRLVHGAGSLIEKHPMFPEGVNVEFIEVVDRSTLRMRVWERGSGETLACGTGANAACVAAYLNGLADRDVTVRLLGGDLGIALREDNTLVMRGGAEFVFDGTVEI